MAVDMSKLNRPGVMSSYSSAGRKNTVHSSKSQVAGSTFNQARISKASSFLQASKAGHVGANRISNGTPKYWNGQEMAMKLNRSSGQVSAFSSNNFFSSGLNSVGLGNMMPNMFGMGGANNTLSLISGLTNLGLNVADRFGLFGSKQLATTNGEALTTSMNSLSTAKTISTNADIQGCVEAMANATNSADLSTAIASAKTQYTSLQSTTAGLEASFKDAQTQLKGLGEDKSNAEKAVKNAQGDVNRSQGVVKNQTNQRDAAKNDLETAMKNKGITNDTYCKAHSRTVAAQQANQDAAANTAKAETALNNAETKLGSTPKTIKIEQPDGSTIEKENPEYKQAQEAVEIAKKNFEKAKAEEQRAHEELEAAQTEEQKAFDAMSEADQKIASDKNVFTTEENNLKKVQQDLDKMTNQQSKYESVLEVKTEAFNTAKENFDTAQKTIDDYKTKTKDMSTLEKEIEKYNKKLTKMQKNEKKATASGTSQGNTPSESAKQTPGTGNPGTTTTSKPDETAQGYPRRTITEKSQDNTQNSIVGNNGELPKAGTQLTNDQLNTLTAQCQYYLSDGTAVNEYKDANGHTIYVNDNDNTVATEEMVQKAKAEGEIGPLIIGHRVEKG